MINIRKGLFETNSSSTHAICIGKDNNNLVIPSELTFEVGEFGWENEVYDDVTTLASYLYTALTSWYGGKELTNHINHIYTLLGHNGCEATFIEPDVDKWGFADGYIDHSEELGEFLNKVLSSDKALLRYLFSPDSFIITGNDNDDWWYDYMEDFYKAQNNDNVEVFEKWN
jgi:hypothetical protein